MKRKVLKPDIIRGGSAIPLGANYYYMKGRKHKDGGIDIGKNPKTGIEVEDEEIMHITPNEVKVFSSVPFLNGESPAQKVLGGENPNYVFKQQENFKDKNNINDDGTKKKAMGGLNRKDDYGSSKKPYPKVNKKDFAGGNRSYPIPTKADAVDALRLAGLHGRNDVKAKVYNKYPELRKKAKLGTKNNNKTNRQYLPSTGEQLELTSIPISPITDTRLPSIVDNITINDVGNTTPNPITHTKGERLKTSIVRGVSELGPNTLSDVVGTGTNIIGSILGYRANRKMLNNLKYSSMPAQRKAAKLKTNININPQLDKMRETLSAYERDINANTSSSRVGLQRKQYARLANVLNTNELYGKKENIETELINRDRINQQQVSDRNITEYNQWARGKADFNNAVAEKKSENKVDFINNLTGTVQDLISRRDVRRREDNDLYINEIVNPVTAKVMKGKGIQSRRSKRKS